MGIKKIEIKKYKRFQDNHFSFTEGINAIAGTNGTCKTSLLHLISNSFQAVPVKSALVNDSKCIKTLNAIINAINPKIETLNRDSQVQYQDPAPNTTGVLYTVTYQHSESSLSFRRHNSDIENRYSIKPNYKRGKKEALPNAMVAYLGLNRLSPYGEFSGSEIEGINKSLPIEHKDRITSIYKSFTQYEINSLLAEKMGIIKKRSRFMTNKPGIDSNTISAGEDNLMIIITTLVALSYFKKSLTAVTKYIPAILLIDEFDASLHPEYQIKLIKLFKTFYVEDNIQIIFTTHSLTTIEEMFKEKQNVIYIVDDVNCLYELPSPDIFKIRSLLENKTNADIYANRYIPIFTEDNEARVFLNSLFEYGKITFGIGFASTISYFHLVDTKISCEALLNIFKDNKVLNSTIRSICILDGDVNEDSQNVDANGDLTNHIILLPGKTNPEDLIFKYANQLYLQNDDVSNEFWRNTQDRLSIGRKYFQTYILPEIVNIEIIIERLHQLGKSAKGIRREKNKKLFLKHTHFFEIVIINWIHNPSNKSEVDIFFMNLHRIYKKTATYHNINPNLWNISEQSQTVETNTGQTV